MKAPPAFQFYPGDFLSSSKVQRMTLAERGAYITLLCFAWEDGSIPNSENELARMISVSILGARKVLPRVLACFVPCPADPENRLVNPKMETIRAELLAYRSERSESGKKGMASRWKDHNTVNNSAIAQPITKNNSSSPSSSSSLNKEEKPSLRSGKKKCPDGLPVTDAHREWAATNHITVDLVAETDAMIDWAHGKAETRADWEATRRNWWRNAQKRNGGNGNGHQPKSRADITRENGESLLRDIENQRSLQRRPEQRDTGYLPE